MFNENLEGSCETFNESTNPSLNCNRSEIFYNGNEKLIFKDGWYYNENNIPLLKAPISRLYRNHKAKSSKNIGKICYTQPVAFSEPNVPQKAEDITKNLKRAHSPFKNSSRNDTYYKIKVPFKKEKLEEKSQLKRNNLNNPDNKFNKPNQQLLLTKLNKDVLKNLNPVCSPSKNSDSRNHTVYGMDVAFQRHPSNSVSESKNNYINNDNNNGRRAGSLLRTNRNVHKTANLNPVSSLSKNSDSRNHTVYGMDVAFQRHASNSVSESKNNYINNDNNNGRRAGSLLRTNRNVHKTANLNPVSSLSKNSDSRNHTVYGMDVAFQRHASNSVSESKNNYINNDNNNGRRAGSLLRTNRNVHKTANLNPVSSLSKNSDSRNQAVYGMDVAFQRQASNSVSESKNNYINNDNNNGRRAGSLLQTNRNVHKTANLNPVSSLSKNSDFRNQAVYGMDVAFQKQGSKTVSEAKENTINNDNDFKSSTRKTPLLLAKRNVDRTTNLRPVCSPKDTSINKKYMILKIINCTPDQNNSINDNNHRFMLLPIKIQENVSTSQSPACILRENSKIVKLMNGIGIPKEDNFINDNIDIGVVNNDNLIKQVPENMDIISNVMPKLSINSSNHYGSTVPFKQDEGVVDTTSGGIHHQNSILPFQQNDNLYIPNEICQSNEKKSFRKLFYYNNCNSTEGDFIKHRDETEIQLDHNNCTLHEDRKRSVSNSTSNFKVESVLHCWTKDKKKSENSTQQRKGADRNQRSPKIETITQPNVHIISNVLLNSGVKNTCKKQTANKKLKN